MEGQDVLVCKAVWSTLSTQVAQGEEVRDGVDMCTVYVRSTVEDSLLSIFVWRDRELVISSEFHKVNGSTFFVHA